MVNNAGYASADEVDSHLRLLAAAPAGHELGPEQALRTFDEVRAMSWRLLGPCESDSHFDADAVSCRWHLTMPLALLAVAGRCP